MRPPRGWAPKAEKGRASGRETERPRGTGAERPPFCWAPRAESGRARCDHRGIGPQKPRGEGPVQPPRGWAPKAERGRARPPWDWAPKAERGTAPCDQRGAGPKKMTGAEPRATAVGLGPEAVPSAVHRSSEAGCAEITSMVAPLLGNTKFSLVCRAFKWGESNSTQPNPPPPGLQGRPQKACHP